jgi:hypothetical protein
MTNVIEFPRRSAKAAPAQAAATPSADVLSRAESFKPSMSYTGGSRMPRKPAR